MIKTEQYIAEIVAEHIPTHDELSRIDKLILRTQLERLVVLAKSELAQEMMREMQEKKEEAKKVVKA